ncbi:DM13 domain-containing protein [Arthrobacter sp. NPDC093125]|uniref:DM13 domain-containing protein n=1 Tax=Arthrobacter sp. NPDC093125 TaxID=3363944 RepID=UPI0038189E9E
MQVSGRKRGWIIAASVIAAVVLAAGLALFKPWLLFVDVRVDEQLPTVAASAEPSQQTASKDSSPSTAPTDGAPTEAPARPVQLAQGTLISHEHAATGTVRIIRQPDGTRLLTLENLDTSNGPDVHVWLSAADVVEGTAGWFTAGSADYFDLGLIKGNQGNQIYAIPADVDLSKYKSVDLWCVQFSISFGAAQLTT